MTGAVPVAELTSGAQAVGLAQHNGVSAIYGIAEDPDDITKRDTGAQHKAIGRTNHAGVSTDYGIAED
ncbi:hypothetical protein SERLADRAFT_377437, partial [Serpula lacrymans var. lacrymans S7.9]